MRPIHGLAALRWVFDLALVASVFAVLAVLVVARGLPAWGHPTLVITGGSMEPAIPRGAVVVLDPIAPSAIRPGDVVTVRLPAEGSHVTHRVLAVREQDGAIRLQTKGDANRTPDPVLLPADDVVGRVTGWIPGLGYLMRLLSVPQGVTFALAFALALYASARLIEELEIEAYRSRRRRAVGPARRPLPAGPAPAIVEPAPLRSAMPDDPDPIPTTAMADPELAALVAAVRLAPAPGPRSPAGWSPRSATSEPDRSEPAGIVEPTGRRDPTADLSPAARRAFRQRADRRRQARAGGAA